MVSVINQHKITTITLTEKTLENLDKIINTKKQIYLESCRTKKERKKVSTIINKSSVSNDLIKMGIELKSLVDSSFEIHEGTKKKISVYIEKGICDTVDRLSKKESNKQLYIARGMMVEDLLIKGIFSYEMGI